MTGAGVYCHSVREIDYAGLIARLPEDFDATAVMRRSVHSFYGGAHLFTAGTPDKLGKIALGYFERYAATPADLATIHRWTFDAETVERVQFT